MAEINNIKKFRQRFVKDYNLPINVFNDKLFEYYMELYDFFPKNVYLGQISLIKEKYDGNVEKWIEYCSLVRDNAINGVMGTNLYKNFNIMDLSCYDIPSICSEKNCYNEETNGKYFLSIDLKQANFQALKYVGVLNDKTYNDFIKKYGGDDYIANSKYLRQVIFGKMNPSRQIKVEKYLMYQVYLVIKDYLEQKCSYKLYSFNSDELIFEEINKVTTFKTIVNDIEKIIKESLPNINVKVEIIQVNKIPIVSSNGNKIDAYERYNLLTGEQKLKKASTTFYPQIYKIWKHIEIEQNDMVFYFENQMATFTEPLKIL